MTKTLVQVIDSYPADGVEYLQSPERQEVRAMTLVVVKPGQLALG